MNFFEGYKFFLCLFIAVIPAVILGILEKKIKYYGFIVSLLFIGLIFESKTEQLVYLVLFYIWQLLCIYCYLMLRRKYGRNEKIYYTMIFMSILPLVLAKISPFVYTMTDNDFSGSALFGFIGVSYLTFKTVQIIIEIYDGLITEIKPFEFTAFLLFFPAISSGPIDRSRRFSEDFNSKLSRDEYIEMLENGIIKILLGAVYKIVLAALFYKLLMQIPSDDMKVYHLIAYAYVYGMYLFFDFAGYSHMAVGVSYIFGIRTPDNFKYPFIAKDMKEFWDRWHITLSYWFRDFIFSRFVMKCAKKKWFKNRTNRACAGFIVNMGVMGIWHGLSLCYILYGLYHGVLLSLTEIYQKKSDFYKKNKEKTWYKGLSWFVTMQLVMFGFLMFSGKII